MSTESVGHLRCPSCGGRDIRHSLQNGIRDYIMRFFRRQPYRCRRCRHRFYRYTAPKGRGAEQLQDAGSEHEPKAD